MYIIYVYIYIYINTSTHIHMWHIVGQDPGAASHARTSKEKNDRGAVGGGLRKMCFQRAEVGGKAKLQR